LLWVDAHFTEAKQNFYNESPVSEFIPCNKPGGLPSGKEFYGRPTI